MSLYNVFGPLGYVDDMVTDMASHLLYSVLRSDRFHRLLNSTHLPKSD